MRSGMYLVIELLTGGMLRAKLRVRKIPVREVVEIRKYLAERNEYSHEKGVVHRDMMPPNVLMAVYPGGDDRSRAKLFDFGVASVRAHEASETSTGGTAA
ncbi:protein kinase [Cryobacterium sp. Y50]|uniref:protein kinase domain-containing protein n=1 Tax=Cryobacterium sp. Y50 TaxID=2048286 RepID=UPI000CE50139